MLFLKYFAPKYWLLSCSLMLMLSLLPWSSQAQEDSRLFSETGKTVRGKFLKYWMEHGGLAQQGFPISSEMQEVSSTDGKLYTVQYFERAVFEHHPEIQAPNDVLLQLLGVFLYKQKYPSGAPQQTPNTSAGSVTFPETGMHLGGLFLAYWKANGGLPQQGYPISEEFQERSDLDGQVYTVQYFERAVFEHHPKNQPPYDILLSQLGTFRYKAKYLQPTATPISPVPAASVTPTPQKASDCSNIPAGQNMIINPPCAPAGSVFFDTGSGFQPHEEVSVYTTRPDGQVISSKSLANADLGGKVSEWQVGTYTSDIQGIWATTMEGKTSGAKAVGYFRLTVPVPVDCSGIPENDSMHVTPNCIKAGGKLEIHVPRSVPQNYNIYCASISPAGKNGWIERRGDGRFIFFSELDTERGIWQISCTDRYIGPEALIGYFKVLPP